MQSNNYDCDFPCNASLACDPGYAPLNQSMQTCLSNLTWDHPPSQMMCIGRLCDSNFPAPSPSYTVNLTTSWAAYPPSGRFQDVLTIACNPGYYAAGGSFSWRCLGNGTWDCAENCSMPSCRSCPAGQFTSGMGMTACLDCQVGYHQPSTGQTSCLSCPVGTFAAVVGQ